MALTPYQLNMVLVSWLALWQNLMYGLVNVKLHLLQHVVSGLVGSPGSSEMLGLKLQASELEEISLCPLNLAQ